MRWFGRRYRELDEEVRFHLDMRAQLNREAGMDSDTARESARRQLGNATRVVEETRRVHVREWLDTLAQDLRYGWRALRRSPGFALAAVCTAALGIGASTAVFSAVDRVLFRSPPYPAADRLVSFGFAAPIEPGEFMLGTDYLEWRGSQKVFSAMTTLSGVDDCDLSAGNPVRLACARVEANFLPVLGIAPLLGRNFTRDEDRPRAPAVALLSYGLWRSRFGGDPGAVGRTIDIDDRPVRVVGVLPAGFEMPTLARADLLLPQALDEARQQRPNTGRVLRAFARLRPGVTVEQAAAGLQPLFRRSLAFVPAAFRKEVRLRVRSLRDRQVADARTAAWTLLGAVLLVWLIACANIANLLLARAVAREREMAVRTALGASRRRLIRLALTESLLLASLGGALGCAVAWGLLRAFVALAPTGIPRLEQASLDSRVLLFTLFASLAAGVAFGLAPALFRPAAMLSNSRRVSGPARGVLRQGLIAAQIAVSLVLLSGAGLLLRSLWNLEHEPLGLRPGGVLTAGVVLNPHRYPQTAQQVAFSDALETRLRALPGVEAVGIADSLPPAGWEHARIFAAIHVEGRPPRAEGTGGMVAWRIVNPDYFSALRIPILRGRGFTEPDRSASDNLIVLSESLARRLFPGESAIGKRLDVGAWCTVIGVAADVKNGGLAARPDPEYYVLRKHRADPLVGGFPDSLRRASFVLRTSLSPEALAPWVRAEVTALDPKLPVETQTMAERVGRLAEGPRLDATLLAAFAAAGVLLAAIGLYGVMAFLVARRTQEIGVRMALGATPGAIARLVLAGAGRWALAGTAAGAAGALAAARFLRALLFRVPSSDPWPLAAGAALLLAVAIAAAWLPARHAARVDPAAALRAD